jgi:hypothetical protein
MHGDEISRLREIGGTLDRAKRGVRRPGIGVVAAESDMEAGGVQRGQWCKQQSGENVLHVGFPGGGVSFCTAKSPTFLHFKITHPWGADFIAG